MRTQGWGDVTGDLDLRMAGNEEGRANVPKGRVDGSRRDGGDPTTRGRGQQPRKRHREGNQE